MLLHILSLCDPPLHPHIRDFIGVKVNAKRLSRVLEPIAKLHSIDEPAADIRLASPMYEDIKEFLGLCNPPLHRHAAEFLSAPASAKGLFDTFERLAIWHRVRADGRSLCSWCPL